MKGLLRKEFRELRPFVLLGVFLLLLDLVEWFTEQLDMQPLATNIGGSSQALAVLLFFMAFAAGTGLLVREMDDRTLAFLDGLPVSRARVFGVKILVAGIVLLLYPAGHLLMLTAQHFISRQSLDHALHAALLWRTAAMICVVTGTGLALGLLLGYLRALCWLMLGLLALALITLTHFLPGFSVLNPVALLEMRLVGLQWQVLPTPLFTQLGLMAGSALLALGIFVSANGGGGRKLQQWLGRPLTSAMLTLATIGACLAALVVFGLLSADKEKSVGGGKAAVAKFADSPVVSRRTERYSFSYHSQQAEQAEAVLKDADRVYAEVAALLGAGDGARVDVDLTGSLQNTEGTAFHDRIRMHMGRDPLKVLAHETAHVLAHRLAGGRTGARAFEDERAERGPCNLGAQPGCRQRRPERHRTIPGGPRFAATPGEARTADGRRRLRAAFGYQPALSAGCCAGGVTRGAPWAGCAEQAAARAGESRFPAQPFAQRAVVRRIPGCRLRSWPDVRRLLAPVAGLGS